MTKKFTTVYLVRHGETVWNLEERFQGQMDSPLSKQGHAQAYALEQLFSKIPLDTLYSSDLGRAMVTAQAIGRSTGCTVQPLEAWRERCFGIFEGKTHPEAHDLDGEAFTIWRSGSVDITVPGGESRRDLYQRSFASLQELIQKHLGQTIAIVSHGGTLSTLWRFLEPECERYSVPNASVSEIRCFESGEIVAQQWSSIKHLGALESLDDPNI